MYLPAEVAKMIGCSATSIRNYTKRHEAHLSLHTRQDPRQYTPEDARVLAFVFSLSKTRTPHEEIAQRLDAGELDNFDWQAPATVQDARQASQEARQEATPQDAALILWQQFNDQLEATRDAARRREIALQEQINSLQHDLGLAQGELAALKAQARPWWVRWFSRDG